MRLLHGHKIVGDQRRAGRKDAAAEDAICEVELLEEENQLHRGGGTAAVAHESRVQLLEARREAGCYAEQQDVALHGVQVPGPTHPVEGQLDVLRHGPAMIDPLSEGLLPATGLALPIPARLHGDHLFLRGLIKPVGLDIQARFPLPEAALQKRAFQDPDAPLLDPLHLVLEILQIALVGPHRPLGSFSLRHLSSHSS